MSDTQQCSRIMMEQSTTNPASVTKGCGDQTVEEHDPAPFTADLPHCYHCATNDDDHPYHSDGTPANLEAWYKGGEHGTPIWFLKKNGWA